MVDHGREEVFSIIRAALSHPLVRSFRIHIPDFIRSTCIFITLAWHKAEIWMHKDKILCLLCFQPVALYRVNKNVCVTIPSVDEELAMCEIRCIAHSCKCTTFAPWKIHHLIGFMALLLSKFDISKLIHLSSKIHKSSFTLVCREAGNILMRVIFTELGLPSCYCFEQWGLHHKI